MGEEISNIYNAIIISLIIGIIITIIVLFITLEPEEHFTEIYFEEHENLPEKIKLNNDYSFSFTTHSLENSTKIYDYKSSIELYNLYDITEGTYRCLGKFRDKIGLKWEFGELINNNTYLAFKNILNDNQNNNLIKNAYTKTIGGFPLENIKWDKYTIDFSYQTIDGLGYISLIFMDESGNNKYALVLSESKNKILFVKFDNNQIRINKKDYELAAGKGYRVMINVEKNKADIYVNDQQIFNIKDVNLKNKKIEFETRDTYALIKGLVIHKTNYDIKDDSAIKEYIFKGNLVRYEHEKLIDKKIDYLRLKTFQDETSSLFDNIYNWMNLEYDEKSDYNQSYKIKSYENKTEEIINWNNYIFEYDYETIQGEGNIIGFFKDSYGNIKYALLISEKNNEVFFLRTIGDKLKISKKTIPIINNEKHNVKIKMGRNDVKIYIDKKLIFNITDLSDYNNGRIEFELKNTNADINNIIIQNEDINYSDPTLYVKYKKKYGIEDKSAAVKRIPDTYTSLTAVKETYAKDLFNEFDLNIENEAAEARIRDLIQEKGILTNPENAKDVLIKELIANPELVNDFIDIINKNNLIQEKEMFTDSENVRNIIIKELISNPKFVNDIMDIIDQSKTKKINQDLNIPSKSMVFNGYYARIQDWTDYVFTFGYTALDGKKQVVNSFQDFDGKNKYSFLISEETNDMLFTNHKNNDKIRKNISIIEESWHTARLEVNNSKAKYYLDGNLIFDLSDVDFTTGQFELGTENTNAHFRQIFALNNDDQKKIYEIQQDPCQLQKIGEVLIDQGKIVLNSDEKTTKTQVLNVNKLFDFGKVSVNVEEREIHFWVTNI